MKRFFLDQDDSGHWYVVPVTRRSEWSLWNELPEDSEERWEAPEWAEHLQGGPYDVTFTDPQC